MGHKTTGPRRLSWGSQLPTKTQPILTKDWVFVLRNMMKNKGFTLMEALVVTLISVLMFGVLLGLFVTGKNTWIVNAASVELQQKARISMERITRELSLSKSDKVTIKKSCSMGSGDMIVFRTPQTTSGDIAGTVYQYDGSIKWGADGDTTKFIKYLVPKSGVSLDSKFQKYVGHLIRLVEGDNPPLPCAIKIKKGFNFKEFVSRIFLSLAYAGSYYTYPPVTTSPPTTTAPPPAPLIAIANNIEKIEFEGFNLYGTSVTSSPSLVKITITAAKTNILGNKITFVLQSNVRLKN
jgi:type II secretory pathway pseudopilin PulG